MSRTPEQEARLTQLLAMNTDAMSNFEALAWAMEMQKIAPEFVAGTPFELEEGQR